MHSKEKKNKKIKNYKIAIIQRIFPHYREPIFDLLNKNINIILIHSRNNDNIPQIVKSYSCLRPMIRIWRFVYISGQIFMYKCRPDVVIHEFSLSLINLYLTYLYCKITKCRLILWGHGYNRTQGFNPNRYYSDKIRSFFIRNSDAVILYTDEVKKEMETWFQEAALYVARNSIQSVEKDKLYEEMVLQGKQYYKIKYECTCKYNLVFIARITEYRKVELLLDLVKNINLLKKIKYLVHIIGDGNAKINLMQKIKNNNLDEYFRVYGAVYDESVVSEILYLSEFMVMPASLGLSVNHAFCYETPVVTLINEKHGPEASFIINDYNGMLCSDMKDMARRITSAFDDEYTISRMSANARQYFCNNLGIESMFKGFNDAISYVKYDS